MVCKRVKEKARMKLDSVQRKIEALSSIGRILQELIEACNRRSPTQGCPILMATRYKNTRSQIIRDRRDSS